MPPDKIPQFPPIATFFTSSVVSAPDEQQVFVVPERHTRLLLAQIHAVHIRCVLEGNDIRAVLIQLEKITAVLVEKGKVCCHNDFLARIRP